MSEKPSIGMIFMEPKGQRAALNRLTSALEQRGYVAAASPPPPGYPLAQDEWLGCTMVSMDAPRCDCVLLDKVDVTFRLALWLSTAFKEQLVIGWRCYRGLDPCMKFFVGGQPRWKIGLDPDHEVGFTVPQHPPHDLPAPESLELPADLESAARLQNFLPASNTAHTDTEVCTVSVLSFISRRSPLAP